METSFAELLTQLQAGDEAAAREIFERYSRRLVGLASRKLAGLLKHKVDAEDIVQSAFKSFFRVQQEGPFRIDGWDNLWSLLTTITLRKCGYQVRHFLAEKRDLRREITQPKPAEDSRASFQVIAREPTPAEQAALQEIVQSLLDGLDDKARMMVELALLGHDAADIATRAGVTERTVYRHLKRIKSQLQAS